MNFKYFPNVESTALDVAYTSVYPSSGSCTEAFEGEGSIKFHPSSFEQNPTQYRLINLLGELPVNEIRGASVIVWEPLMLLDRVPLGPAMIISQDRIAP